MIRMCLPNLTQNATRRNRFLPNFLHMCDRTAATEASFEIKPYKLHKIDKGPPTTAKLSAKDALELYTKMATIRRMENAAAQLYKEQAVKGFCHLYAGEEACAVGMEAVMRKQDSMITAYRCHGWAYLMGISVEGILAELTGRKNGCTRGKGGSMHMYCPRFYGGNGIVAAQVPVGTGVAFAQRYLGSDGVCIVLYGDGAANQGQVFESFNMACLWKLPALYVVENNGFGMGTKAERAAFNPNYYTRGDYMPGIWVDGMDVLAVRSATQWAINYITSGKGPLLMECATYRYFGHSMSDPGTSYRTREEIQEVREKRDPVAGFRAKIIKAQLVTEDQLKKLDAEIKKTVEVATKKSLDTPEPGLDELAACVYIQSIEPNVRGRTPFEPFKHVHVPSHIALKQ